MFFGCFSGMLTQVYIIVLHHAILQREKEDMMRLPLKRYLTLLLTYLKPQWLRTLVLAVLLLHAEQTAGMIQSCPWLSFCSTSC